jgi:hypothetical protein
VWAGPVRAGRGALSTQTPPSRAGGAGGRGEGGGEEATARAGSAAIGCGGAETSGFPRPERRPGAARRSQLELVV